MNAVGGTRDVNELTDARNSISVKPNKSVKCRKTKPPVSTKYLKLSKRRQGDGGKRSRENRKKYYATSDLVDTRRPKQLTQKQQGARTAEQFKNSSNTSSSGSSSGDSTSDIQQQLQT